MKHSDMVRIKKSTHSSLTSKNSNTGLSEADVLFLQDMFLTPGVHTIQCANNTSGRILIQDILDSLPIYTSVACLTMHQNSSLPPTVFDIYRSLHENGLSEQAIEEFFIDEFYFDFLWIEVSDSLVATTWYKHFCHVLTHYEQNMAIIRVH